MRALYKYKNISVFKFTLLILAVSTGFACGRSNAESENQNAAENQKETVVNVYGRQRRKRGKFLPLFRQPEVW